MCGIVGIVSCSKTHNISPFTLQSMTDSLSHRGPDDEGIYISSNGFVGLGNRRLSINDFSSKGRQPMEKHGYVVSFNGEIFNFKEINKELIQYGYTFKTGTDTETILSAYDKWGIECLKKFNGFFGLVIFDKRNDEVYIIRDRLGVKTISYAEKNGNIIFASESKAILKHPDISTDINTDVLLSDLVFNFWGDKRESYFKGIHHLQPGHYLYIKNGKVKDTCYWDIEMNQDLNTLSDQEIQEAIQTTYEKLLDSVKLRLIADCEIGTILSGGLDSSLLTQIASQHDSRELKCFTLQYGDEVNLDLECARALVQNNPLLNHHIVHINQDDISVEDINFITYHMEEVLLDKAYFSVFSNYKAARSIGLKAVLNGQGSDEMWLGYYNTYPFIKMFEKNISLDAFRDYWENKYFFSKYTSKKRILNVIDTNINNNLKPYIGKDSLNSLIGFATKTHLQSMLMQEDKLSMAASVECRVPFVDYNVVEYSMKLPSYVKILDEREKFLLRKVGEPILPKEIYIRPKSVFPDMPDAFGRIADAVIRSEGFRKSPLLHSLFSEGFYEGVKVLPPVQQWKMFAIYQFEKTFL